MDCLNRERLRAYADGDASPAEEAHLEDCPHCQDSAAEFLAPLERALGRAAREPAYEVIEIDRAAAVIGGLGASSAAPGTLQTGPHRPAASTVTVDDLARATAPAAPPAPGVDLSFLKPPQAPGELGRLGNYRVFGVLGQGGMGVVLRAEDVRLGRPVALKIMRPQRDGDRTAHERFLREARLLAQVRHERVVPVYEADEAEGVPYLAMPLLEGESLRSRLERTPGLSVAEAVRVAREAAEGLAAAHQCGLVHRDVKPANLWLELGADGWQVRVLDFGLARPQSGETLTRPGGVLGTPAYMAPEQARGDEVDGRGDLFSLGCVLYQMLTGISPFAGRDVLAMLRRLELHEPEPPRQVNPAVPEALSSFVLQLLAKDREERPKTAREVAATLAMLERGLPTTQPTTASFPAVACSEAAPRATATAPQAPVQRRRWLWIGTGAAVLAGAVALVVLLPRWDAPSVPINPATKQVLPPLKGSLDVLIYEKENPRRQDIFLDEAGAMPLRPEDQFCIEAEVNRPAYLYVLWIDTDGKVQPLYPWQPGHWDIRPEEERPVAKLRRPEELDLFYKVPKGTTGMETLVLLARETPLPHSVDLRAELGALERPAVQELKATVWFENGLPVRNRRGRAGMFDVTRRSDPVLATQQRIKERLLGRHFAYALAVSFANRGE